ncbi:MAG: SDR family oxidoreductase [Yoonia sp.]
MKVLILGADGFIGRHIAFAFREAGITVIASARRVSRLSEMGFATLQADLTDPATHSPAFWAPHVDEVDWIINAAGLLTGSESDFKAVHVSAPSALYQAHGGRALFLGAVGIEQETAFAKWRKASEDIAATHNVTILRAGLVMADTSYGGTSLGRALAAFPLVMPLVGGGAQEVNPVHACDLAEVIRDILRRPYTTEILTIGGPEVLTQRAMLESYRRWLGLPKAKALPVPLLAGMALGRIGDVLRMGPISATSIKTLSAGILAMPSQGLPAVRPFSQFLWARPAGTQDLWHARLYLLRPLLRIVLAVMWIASGLIGLFLPQDAFLPAVSGLLPDGVLVAIARLGGVADLLIAWGLLRNWRPLPLALIQIAMVSGYTLGLTILAPALWLLPFGGLLKNLPVLALLLASLALAEER